MSQVVDYSFSHPDPADIVTAGYVGVMRYLCPRSSSPSADAKRLQPAELEALFAAGLKVGLVWEHTADSSSWDGREALKQRADLGLDERWPIFFAQDQQAGSEPSLIAHRLDATGVPAGQRGLYAGAPLVQRMIDDGHAAYGWIAAALSQSGVDYQHQSYAKAAADAIALAPSAGLFQRVGYVLSNTSDVNDVLLDDWGGRHPRDVAGPTPSQPDPQEDDDIMAAATPEQIKLMVDAQVVLGVEAAYRLARGPGKYKDALATAQKISAGSESFAQLEQALHDEK